MSRNRPLIARNLCFNLSSVGTIWLNNDPYLTHMFDASSLLLPYVEGFVISVSRMCQPYLNNEKLARDCEIFAKQETYHSREHNKYNSHLKNKNYRSDHIIANIRRRISAIKSKWSMCSMIAVGAAFENITMQVSYTALNENTLQQACQDLRSFWEWHMKEELEHKTTLIDIYHELGGGYFRRISIYSLVLFYYCYCALRIYFDFLSVSHASRIRGLWYVLTKNTFFIKGIIRSFSFYKPNYHPGTLNCDHLLMNE